MDPSLVESIISHVTTNHQHDLDFKSSKSTALPSDHGDRYAHLNSLLEKDPALFLERYGQYLTLSHLSAFSACQQWKDDYEVTWHLTSLLSKQHIHSLDVQHDKKAKLAAKNRRYTKLQSLIKDTDYFNDTNIQSRYPYLYHKYVGQYAPQTTFSDSMPLSSRLLQNMDEDDMRTRRLSDQRRFRNTHPNEDEDDDGEEDDNPGRADAHCRQEEEEEEEEYEEEEEEEDKVNGAKTDPSYTGDHQNGHNTNRPSRDISHAEMDDNKSLLMDIVYQKFLIGEDKDFDYSEVDNDEQLDPETIDRDLESKYFDDEDDDGDDNDGQGDNMSD